MYRKEFTAHDANWLVSQKGDIPLFDAGRRGMAEKVECPLFRCHAQIRYNAEGHLATLTILDGGRFRIEFDEPQFAVTPGQAVVCYDAAENERVLGGGWIE
jgi:tRNA-specific 2-thiouridylase